MLLKFLMQCHGSLLPDWNGETKRAKSQHLRGEFIDHYKATGGCYRLLQIQIWQLYSCGLYISSATCSYGSMCKGTTHFRVISESARAALAVAMQL